MKAATLEYVRRRADDRCEYCLLREEHAALPHQIDHVVARQHRVDDDPSNLALARIDCNRRKGPNLAGIDPVGGGLVALFDPRRDSWDDHFTLQGPEIVGLTPTGRATVVVLAMNADRRRLRRALLIAAGDYP